MKVIGNMIKLMDMDVSYMLMATVIMVIGKMIKLTAEELMNTWTVLSMLVTGKKINNMDMVLKLGQMHRSMKVIINLVKNMG